MSKSPAKIITGAVIVLALWSCKSSTPTGNLTASNTNQDQASLNAEERYGLSEAKRRQISEEIHSLWIQASKLASNKYPVVVQGEQPRTFIEKMKDRARKRDAMVQSLTAEYLDEVARKYNLSQEQLTDIINEGIDKQWTNYPKQHEYR
jgi:DNA invertase Pin-like site-specific DNA recombinase